MAELTLELDQELLQKVSRWAESKGMSVNEAGASLLRSALNAASIGQIPDPNSSSDLSLELTSWTQSLVGMLKPQGDQLDDETLKQQYLDYLEEKYQ